MNVMTKPTMILLLLNFFFLVTSQACPSSCVCDVPGEVDCRNSGLSAIPAAIPPDTTHFLLQNNNISSLSLKDFENLVNLTELRLEENAITKIEDNTFLNNSKLLVLSLDNNNLIDLAPETFKGAAQLAALHLKQNPDLTAKPGTFQQLESLQHLYLSDTSFPGSYDFKNMENLVELEMSNCSIASLPLEYFTGLEGLTSLNLDNNQLMNVSFLSSLALLECVSIASNNISEIPPGTFNSTQRLRKINMNSNNIEILPTGLFSGLKYFRDGSFEQNHIEHFTPDIFDKDLNLTEFRFSVHWNPIYCDCHMRWIASTKIEGQCYGPKFVAGYDFSNMNLTDYQCGPTSKLEGPKWFTVYEGGTTILECPLSIDPPESAVWETPAKNISVTMLPSSDQSGDVYILKTGNLKVQNAKIEHQGIYSCQVGNRMGKLHEGPLFLDVEVRPSESGSTILALSISLGVMTLFFLFILCLLFRKRFRGSASSRYRFLLENSGGGTTAEI